MFPIIAIVGRPNVGKSALFNRLVGRRIAIVHDQPGVTRDRISAEAEWNGRSFTLVDTGGIGLLRGERADDVIVQAALAQVELAIESAHLIILVTDAQQGLLPLDQEAAARLRRSGKPVLLAVNKVDTSRVADEALEFTELGFEKVFPVSAIHGEGIGELMDEAMGLLPEDSDGGRVTIDGVLPSVTHHASRITDHSSPLKLAIVGRPNVGKSSLINALTQSERVVVSPIPGTTRDAVDVPLEIETEGVRQKYILIDTAGIRKTRRLGDSIEFFSVKRAEQSIARCDLALLVLDADAGITEQDKKIADTIVAERKACLLVVNKWDLMAEAVRKARIEEIDRRGQEDRPRGPKTMTTLSEFGQWVQEQLFFLDYAPVIFTSATSGFHLERLLEAVRFVAAQLRQQVPTAILNRTLQDAVERRQPPSARGDRLKFFYATQTSQTPPTFLLFVNRAELLTPAYKKYLVGRMRDAFGYEGCPIVVVPRARPRTVEPVRHRRRAPR